MATPRGKMGKTRLGAGCHELSQNPGGKGDSISRRKGGELVLEPSQLSITYKRKQKHKLQP